ncbi:MAG: DUF547 domain-containing protein [Pseudomonadota bacterium]|nr:DUF547 domain-containing protein [Pseudomonadota bacterium]
MPGAARADDLADAFAPVAGQTGRLDHAPFTGLLKAYVRPGADGLNRVDYAGWKRSGTAALDSYIRGLEQADPAHLSRDEQFAFWANLYNAVTLREVLRHYPVASIRDIRLSGFLVAGPWREKIVTVAGRQLSLDDIEHRILRPIWRDARIHYVVNCASVGCPNLQDTAWTGEGLDARLDAAARAYINSPRGVAAGDGGIVVSTLYDWYADDFGRSDEAIVGHMSRHAGEALAATLRKKPRIVGHAYDWTLNDVDAKR